jgi:hypothetical protein
MSYNIDSHDIQRNEGGRILAKDVARLLSERYESDLPESHFLQDLEGVEPDADGYVPIKDLYYSGEGSGRAYPFLLKKVLPKTRGTLEAVYYWEGGDSMSGLMVEDGVVTECEVEVRLVKPAPKRRRKRAL